MKRRGIVLAGGTGSRLHPLTAALSKQLLPVYDKPLIYYPLTTLMLGSIREILLITDPTQLDMFQRVLGDGSQWGVELTYATQDHPTGIPEALIIGESFLSSGPSALILGDNVFFGHGLTDVLKKADAKSTGATIFAYQVRDPERYGVVLIDEETEEPLDLLEKPDPSPSSWAVTGLYYYDSAAPALARELQPSSRGETEITDLNARYLEMGALHVELLYRGYAWLDTGTHSSLHQASSFVQTVQERQGLLIASPEEIAFRMGYIEAQEFERLAAQAPASEYGSYLRRIASADF